MIARIKALPRVVRAALVAQAAVLLVGVFGWPLHQAPDEPWHVDLVAAVADGRAVPWPDPGTLKQTRGIEAGLVPAGLSKTDVPTYCRCRVWTAASAPDPWPSWADAGGATPTRQPNWMVQHPPLYYGLGAAALWLLPDWPHQPYDVLVYWLRLFDVLLLLPLPLLAFLAARRLTGDETVGSVAAVLMLAVPFLQHLGSSVNNDNLLIPLCAGVTVLLAGVVRGDTRIRTALLVGLLTGAALLTKGTALVLPPFVVLSYVLARRRAAVLPGLLAVASGLALGGWWWVRNQLLFGTVQPNGLITDQSIVGKRPHVTTLSSTGVDFATGSLAKMSDTFWLNTAVRTLPGWITVSSAILSVLALVLLAVGLLRGRLGSGTALWTLVPALGIAAIIAGGAAAHWLRTERIGGVQGRYLYPALVALAVPVALGLVTLARRWAVPVVAVGAVALQVSYGLAVAAEFWLPRTGGFPVAEAWRNAVAWSPLPGWAYAMVVLGSLLGLALLAVAALSGRDSSRDEQSSPAGHLPAPVEAVSRS